MSPAADVVFPFEGPDGIRPRCRVRVYEPEDPRDAPVVVCSELAGDHGPSVAQAASTIAGRVTVAFRP